MKLKDWKVDDGSPIYQAEVVTAGELPAPLTKQEFIQLCENDFLAAERLFNELTWQDPAAYLQEKGGLENYIYGWPREEIVRTYRTDGALINRFRVRGGMDLHVQVPEGLENLAPRVGLPTDPEALRSWLVERFTPVVGAPEDGSPVTVLFHPYWETHALSEAEFTGVNCPPRTSPDDPKVARLYAHCEFMPDAFEQRRLREALGAMLGEPWTRMELTSRPPTECEIIRENHFTMLEIAKRYEAGDPRALLARNEVFQECYGIDWRRGALQQASNRGYAYVGPVVLVDATHVFQLDLVNNIIAVHCIPDLMRGERPVPDAGASYAIIKDGSITSPYSVLPDGVDVAMASAIKAAREWARTTGRYADQKGLPRTVEIIEARTRPAGPGSGPRVEFMANEVKVGEAVDWDKYSIGATPLGEEDARSLADEGLPIHYMDGAFFVSSSALKAAAYEQLGWYQPPGASIISSTAQSAWIQEGKLKRRFEPAEELP